MNMTLKISDKLCEKAEHRAVDESKSPCFILPIDLSIAKLAEDFRAVNELFHNNSLLAATAGDHGHTLATRDGSDSDQTGVNLTKPWEYGE